MKKGLLLFVLISLTALLLTACGGKDEDAVVSDLSRTLNDMQSYKGEAELILQTGDDPQEYLIEVWHKKPHYYRIGLTNKEREMTQIILRNDDGVFVLTPHLNKSFRFQSGWPENQGQVYLYESLVNDILSDADRKFTAEGNQYVFEVAANYQNRMLTSQRITLTKDLKPVKVEVMDADYNVMVVVNFRNVEFDHAFENEDFDMERNMQGELMKSLPVMADETEQHQGSFGVYYPGYVPGQAELVEEQEIAEDNENPKVVLRYAGDYHFNIIQERPQAKRVSMPKGEPVDLGFTIGVMTENSLQWTYEGVDFILSSDGLPPEEMMAIARSFEGQASK